jgi:hypothetical protein
MAAIEGLAGGGKQGRPIDDIRPGYRKLAVASHFEIQSGRREAASMRWCRMARSNETPLWYA